jgi:hypothetical protein
VDQDVGDDRRFRWLTFTARRVNLGLQFLEFFPARWVSEQCLKFLFSLLDCFGRSAGVDWPSFERMFHKKASLSEERTHPYQLEWVGAHGRIRLMKVPKLL